MSGMTNPLDDAEEGAEMHEEEGMGGLVLDATERKRRDRRNVSLTPAAKSAAIAAVAAAVAAATATA
eukprot:CAMPEP_0175078098 /NCGR_PEP_ID=MMETSP0052_2-20121109/23875_1 /TAXON_ID=51329 ORGANISM="Polytomella parva, Strain SAG 63-3" /NCGR_SAMPLE_ID=MMETSP0052_2 /ASSEMBLY_ACC=CAM_ASM_000194 /LENGTH=66 /DNA_ID=CAMNT_0016347873 /DNA_START=1 /DNA_END=198 /DNA_ORIENTATION=+